MLTLSSARGRQEHDFSRERKDFVTWSLPTNNIYMAVGY